MGLTAFTTACSDNFFLGRGWNLDFSNILHPKGGNYSNK